MIESHESTTAKLCSFARAYHSTYARKKIFDDSLAFDFMGLEQYEETGQLIGHNYQENLIDPNLSFHSSEIVDKLNHYRAINGKGPVELKDERGKKKK